MNVTLPVSQELLQGIAKIDHFRGVWAGGSGLPGSSLDRMREAARIQSVASACRIAGIKVTDAEVATVLSRRAAPVREADRLLGYAAALELDLPGPQDVLTTETLRRLHAVAMGSTGETIEPTPWRTEPYHLEVFDADGRALGRVIQTLPPRLVPETMEEVVTWLELELRGATHHPVLVIATFFLFLAAACPFSSGNGRVAYLMTAGLLRRAGYDYMPYASLERVFEEMRGGFFDALDTAETQLWGGEADLLPWLRFFVRAMQTHCERVKAKVDLERRARDFTPLQQAILETVREHGSVPAGLLLTATGANRNTLKDNLRRLVEGGMLERIGRRRGTRYRLATGEPIAPTGESGDE